MEYWIDLNDSKRLQMYKSIWQTREKWSNQMEISVFLNKHFFFCVQSRFCKKIVMSWIS